MSFVANGPFSLKPYDKIGEKKDGSAKGVGSSSELLGVGDFSDGTLSYFKLNNPLWQNPFTLALADNTHDLDADFTDCERSGADRETKFWSKFAFTMAIAGGFSPSPDISNISDDTNSLNYLQTNYSYLNRIPRIYLSDENFCTLGIMYDTINRGHGSFQFIALNPGDRTLMGAAGGVLSGLLAKFNRGRGIPVIIDTSKGFMKMVEEFNPTAKTLDLPQFCYMRTAATIADPSTTPGVGNMVTKFGIANVYCEYLKEEGRVVKADDLIGNVEINYTNLKFNSIYSNENDKVTATYAITGGPLRGIVPDIRTLIANTGAKHVNSINFVKAEFLNAQKTVASTGGFAYPGGLFGKQISGSRAGFYEEFNHMLNNEKTNDAVRTLMKTYTMGCARKRTSDAAQGDDCDKLPGLTFHGLNPDGKSINTDESVTMGVMGVMVTIDRLLFARQVARCSDAAAILDSGTHMIVYIPGGDEEKKAITATAQEKLVESTIPPEPALPKIPLTKIQQKEIEDRLRADRRFRRSTIMAAAAAAEAERREAKKRANTEAKIKKSAETDDKKDNDAANDDEYEDEYEDENDVPYTWVSKLEGFLSALFPSGSGLGGGTNKHKLLLDGLYQNGGALKAEDLDLATILSYLYTRGGEEKEKILLFGKFKRIIDKIRTLFTSGLITFRYYNDQTHNAVYICNSQGGDGNNYSDDYIDYYLNTLRDQDLIDPFDGDKPPRLDAPEVIFRLVYFDYTKKPVDLAADFSIVRYDTAGGQAITLLGFGFDEIYLTNRARVVALQKIFNAVNKIDAPLETVLWGADTSPDAPLVASTGATLFQGGGERPFSVTSVFRAPFEKLSSVENLPEINIGVLYSLLKMLRNYETSFMNYREGRDMFYNMIDDGFPLKMLPNIVMASSVEVYVFVRLMLDDYTAERTKTINYGLFEYCLYSQKDKNYIYTCLQDIKDYILGTDMYYISPTETDIIPAKTRAYFADLFTRTVFLSSQIYSQTYELTNEGNYEAIYKLASDNYLTMGGFHELSEIFMAKTGKILEELPPGVLSKYDKPVSQNSSKDFVEESEAMSEVGKDVGMGLNIMRGTPTKMRFMTPPSPLREGRGGTANFKKSIKKQRTRKLTRGKKRGHGKKRTRKRGIKRRHHTKRKV